MELQKQPLKVIQLNACNGLFGGIEALLVNVFKFIDKDKIIFDFLTCGKTTYDLYKKEIIEMNGTVNEIKYDNKFLSKLKLMKNLYMYLKKSEAKIIHINSSAFSIQLLVSFISALVGIPIRIIHCHNFKKDKKIKKILRKILKQILCFLGTDFFACSFEAAEWMFTDNIIKNNKYSIIKNGIEIGRFLYNEDIRKEYRKKLDIEDKIVIGHIGRFQKQKNHEFLIKIFNKLYKYSNKYHLLLIGEGELENKIRQMVKKYKIENGVTFLGVRKDVENLYQAMDLFLFPSLFEGLGIVAIEAQTSGLQTIVSDTLPNEVKITNLLNFISLKKDEKEWAEIIKNIDFEKRKNLALEIKNTGYSIKDTSSFLEDYYIKRYFTLIRENRK